MKKFKFNLESVLKYREIVQKQQERRLGEAGAALNEARDELTRMRTDLEQSYLVTAPAQSVDVTSALLYEQYRGRLAEEIEAKRAGVADLQAQFNERRAALAKAAQDKQALVTLKEKALAGHRQEMDKQQQNLVDELTSLRREDDGKEDCA